MRADKFKELIENEKPERIIGKYTHLKISLTERQLERVLKIKNEKEGEQWKSEHKQTGC